MPIISIRNVSVEAQLGLWKIEENVDDFYSLYPLERFRLYVESHLKSESRKREFLAVRALLASMLPGNVVDIDYNEAGKPFIKDYKLSISHTRGYAAVILSPQHEVAVDIEYVSERVGRIVSKFVRHDEVAPDIRSQLLHWSAKETVYKFFSEDDLQYFDMRLREIGDSDCLVDNLKRGSQILVHYECNQRFMLTYAIAGQ